MTQDSNAQAEWQVTCQCGWRTHGTKASVVQAVQAHGQSEHARSITEDEVMALAVPFAAMA